MNALRQLLGGFSEDELSRPDVQNALAQILQQDQMPQPNYDIPRVPDNTLRFENGPDAGRTVSLDFRQQPQQPMRVAQMGTDGIYSDAGQQSAPLQKDFSRPIEIAGKGKGYWSKDGGSAIIDTPNGPTQVRMGVDREASYLASKRAFEKQKGLQEMDQTDAQIAQTRAATEHTQEQTAASAAARNMREDPTSQAVLSKKFGKAEDGKRWTADGRLEPIPGNQKQTEANEVLQILDMAKPLVDKATGSTIGTMVDAGARMIGQTADGANEAAQLKTLEGALISKMPKMSGPQSDKDVLLYKQMAGQIGDSTIPATQKHAAMDMIRQLNEKYVSGGMQAPAPQAAPNAAVPPAAQRNMGQVYSTPKGPLRWMGNGWAKP